MGIKSSSSKTFGPYYHFNNYTQAHLEVHGLVTIKKEK